MPCRYYCDFCGVYLLHDSPAGRKQHMRGAKHRDKVKEFYYPLYPEWALTHQVQVHQAHLKLQQSLLQQYAPDMAAMQQPQGAPTPGVMPPGVPASHMAGAPPPNVMGAPTLAPTSGSGAPAPRPTFRPPPKRPPSFSKPPPKK